VDKAELTEKQKIDLVNFYYKILEKDPQKPGAVSNPIIKAGGREAFLHDIEKLRSAEQAISETLMRIHTAPV
jgi:hypothetical protein